MTELVRRFECKEVDLDHSKTPCTIAMSDAGLDPSIAATCRRWCRRHPCIGCICLAFFVVALGAVLFLLVGYWDCMTMPVILTLAESSAVPPFTAGSRYASNASNAPIAASATTVGPSWTRSGGMEAPAGERNEGSYVRAVYTEDQQLRLGVNEDGQAATNTATHTSSITTNTTNTTITTITARVLSYNVYMRTNHIFDKATAAENDFKDERLTLLIDEQLDRFDIILFQESWAPLDGGRKRRLMAAARAKGFSYFIRSSCRGKIVDAMLLIMSRYPITDAEEMSYKAGAGQDAMSSKGVLWARVRLVRGSHNEAMRAAASSCDIDLFNTHLQSGGGRTGVGSGWWDPMRPRTAEYHARYAQLSELGAFVRAKMGQVGAGMGVRAGGNFTLRAGDGRVRQRAKDKEASTRPPGVGLLMGDMNVDMVRVFACVCVCLRVFACVCVCLRVCVAVTYSPPPPAHCALPHTLWPHTKSYSLTCVARPYTLATPFSGHRGTAVWRTQVFPAQTIIRCSVA